jgi:hypothetical protein
MMALQALAGRQGRVEAGFDFCSYIHHQQESSGSESFRLTEPFLLPWLHPV